MDNFWIKMGQQILLFAATSFLSAMNWLNFDSGALFEIIRIYIEIHYIKCKRVWAKLNLVCLQLFGAFGLVLGLNNGKMSGLV